MNDRVFAVSDSGAQLRPGKLATRDQLLCHYKCFC